MKTDYLTLWHLIAFYLPLGLIGFWRWSIWLFRKIVSRYYQVPTGTFSGTLSIITPVYNEDPQMFQLALQSWKANNPEEIIAVIDYADQQSIELFKNFSQEFKGAKLVVTKVPGKRPALAEGVKKASSEIVALVDSDTIWSDGIKDQLLSVFSDPQIGGVCPRQDVLETDTLARKLFKIHLDNRFLNELTYLAVLGDALTCLSGRTAVYRRDAVLHLVDEMVNEKFLGKPVISGDDKTLTRLVQSKRWKVRYNAKTVVYTPGFPDMKTFFKQLVRWNRNSWRSDLKSFFSRWIWQQEKWLAFHMIDRFIPPFTLLIGPIYLVVTLYYREWLAAGILLVWWMLSRAIKIYPHFKEKPKHILILPAYVLMTFVLAVIKIFALLTLDKQGWITRWDKKRLERLKIAYELPTYAATLAIIIGLFFVVSNYKAHLFYTAKAKEKLRIAKELKRQELAAKRNIFTPGERKPAQEFEQIKQNLAANVQAASYGYYLTKEGDTIELLKKRFNLSAEAKILNAETKKALAANQYLAPGQSIAIAVNDLRQSLSKDQLDAIAGKPLPEITYDSLENTIFLKKAGSVVTLSDIYHALAPNHPNLLSQNENKEWILRANLYVSKYVTLLLDGSEVSHLKLKSEDSSYIFIRSEGGNVLISNTKVTSWDEKKDGPDTDDKDGRSYITAKNSGRMDVINSEIGYLGYVGTPRRGGLFGGSYGISWKIKNRSFKDNLLTGVVKDSKFHHNYFGFYTYGATGMVIDNNDAYDNVQYGFDPHDDSNNLLITNNRAYNNGNHGIIISRRCFNNTIADNVSHDNRLHGIMLDRQSDRNIVINNHVYNNVDGIAVYDSHENLILDNQINNNKRGVRLNVYSSNNFLSNNTFLNNITGLYIYDDAHHNIAYKNQVRENQTGISLKKTSANLLYDNFLTKENKKDGNIGSDCFENDIK